MHLLARACRAGGWGDRRGAVGMLSTGGADDVAGGLAGVAGRCFQQVIDGDALSRGRDQVRIRPGNRHTNLAQRDGGFRGLGYFRRLRILVPFEYPHQHRGCVRIYP